MSSRLFATSAVLLTLVSITPTRAVAQAGLPYSAPADDSGDDEGAPTPKPAKAKGPPAAVKPVVAEPETPAPTPAPEPAPEPAFVSTQSVIEKLWESRRVAIAANKIADADRLLKEIISDKEQAGWPNIFAYGEALARESEQALRSVVGTGRAVELAQAAVLVAPDLPNTHLALSAALWAQGGSAGAAIAAYVDGYLLTWRETPFFRARLGTILLALMATVLALAAAFALLAFYRHLRLMLHDLHHLLPHGATRLQAGIIGMVVVIMPIFLRLGWAPVLLTWIVLFGLYYRPRERAGAILVLLLLAALPLALPWGTSFLAASGSRSEAIFLAARDMLAKDAVERVESIADPKLEELYVLGLRARWSGDLHKAVDLLSRAERVGASDPRLYTHLGNLKYLLGDRAAAIAYYNRALGIDPNNVVALFNLSRVYYVLAEQQKAGEAHRKATAIDYELVETFARDAKRIGPTYVVNASVPGSLLRVPQTPDLLHERAIEQAWSILASPAVTRFYFAGAALAGLVLMVLMAWLKRLAHPSPSCPRCGAPACTRCNPELPDQAQCGQCYHAFVSKEAVDPQARIRKEIEVHRHQARDTRVRQAFSFVMAGLSQLASGATLKGLGLFGLFAAAAIGLTLNLDILPTPTPAVARALGWPTAIGLGALAIVSYAAGLIDAQRKER